MRDSCRSARLAEPLNWLAANAGESFGVVLANRCTWPGMIWHATIRHPCPAAFAPISSRSRIPGWPLSTCLRYVGHHTTCRPRSYTPPADTCTSRAMRLVYQLGMSNKLTATPGDAIPLPPKDGSPLAQNLAG